ncbi:NADPH:quinone reductase-like Zn-dependent oxidoreductase [Kitasatospora sp. MAA4]|uniref:NADP-dependent oxidoreductase n=1 Tax=Kitasatospora sp. MAA4 TaxID=3035093 RepID=UPI002473CA40|nr:NADP-dependent oxidoreductase [Kitasatospora sp. MAA4]MDH6137613.1 NADPH:quinone reductase-like Zn-dependent oxidoreductase [Kitasatospora sp. MAA4]
MKAAVIHSYGPVADVVTVGEVPAPAVGPRDVLIEARAAGVNPIDHLIAKGFMQPEGLAQARVLGNEVAGVVAAVGDAVTGFAVGDQVFARVDPQLGAAFAEFVAVDESLVAAKPASISFEEAASLPLVALTAWQALTEQSQLLAGQRVLIHGGAGGVGAAAIQIAKHLGAEVVTTVSADSVELVRGLGADQVVDYRSEKFEEVVAPVDVVLDTVGGDTQDRSFALLKPGGTLVSIVFIPDVEAKKAQWGVQASAFFMHPDGAQLARIAELVASGELRPVVQTVLPLDRAADALTQVERGRARGRTVLSIPS